MPTATESTRIPAHGQMHPLRTHSGGKTTMEKNDRIHIELTTEQRKLVKEASGQDVTALEFRAEELEQRIAPSEILITKSWNSASPA